MYASVANHPSPTCSYFSTPQTHSRTPLHAQSAAPASRIEHPSTLNLQQTKSRLSPASAVVPQPPTPTHRALIIYYYTLDSHLPPQLSHRDLHSPRIDLFRQTRCHLLHLRVPHEHTPSIWLIQDRATTAPILLPSKDMATSSSEYFSNSAYTRKSTRTDTSKAPIRLPATSSTATRLWIPTTTAAASMGRTSAAAAVPATIPPAASCQLWPGDDTVPVAAGADV